VDYKVNPTRILTTTLGALTISVDSRVIAIAMRIWVIAIRPRVGVGVGMIAVGTVGPIHVRRGNAIAAHRDAASVGSTGPSGTAAISDGRHT
jgi:hypothetical protein